MERYAFQKVEKKWREKTSANNVSNSLAKKSIIV